MGIPIDPPEERLATTDEQRLEPVPSPPARPADPEAPDVDAVEQAQEVVPGWRFERRSSDPEAPEADALDQAMAVPLDEDEDD